jgi:LysM repeat protein
MSKNTHLEHLEDSILLDGKNGASDAFKFLDLLAKTFMGKGTNSFKVTTKWDGAPAIFCGHYPGTDNFFVGTKSVFNKDAKINFSESDVDVNHGHAPGLVSKLKDALKYFPKLNVKGVAQGDLLFTDDKKYEVIDGKRCITFQPNTITYAIPEGSPLFAKAQKAKIGVVFHTTYKGDTVESLSATFGYDISKLKETSDVLVLSAETDLLGKDILLTKSEKDKLARMKSASANLIRVSGDFLDKIAEQIEANDQLTVGPRLKIFFNSYVRQGRRINSASNFVRDFEKYFETEVQKAVDKVKTPKAKVAKLNKLYDGMQFISDNKLSLMKTVALYTTLQGAKHIFIRKLEKGEKIGTYLRTEDGYKLTAPEGYVAISNETTAVKLVDRLSFSVANFNVSKNWVSGDSK